MRLWILLLALSASPPSRAESCGLLPTFVNHTKQPLSIQWKVFSSLEPMQAPHPDDFQPADSPATGIMPATFSHIGQTEVPAGSSVEIPF
ncbi:MAG: hypothetical protein ABWY34_03710, partial [Pseudoxanthomonas sp.]